MSKLDTAIDLNIDEQDPLRYPNFPAEMKEHAKDFIEAYLDDSTPEHRVQKITKLMEECRMAFVEYFPEAYKKLWGDKWIKVGFEELTFEERIKTLEAFCDKYKRAPKLNDVVYIYVNWQHEFKVEKIK